jgi:hypothetical protein
MRAAKIAIHNPIPDEPPVTTTCFPVKQRICDGVFVKTLKSFLTSDAFLLSGHQIKD